MSDQKSDVKSENVKSQSTEEAIDFDEIAAEYAHQPDLAEESQFSGIPIRTPKNDEFFRCHPDEAYTRNVNTIKYKSENEVYIIKKSVYRALKIPESCFLIQQLYVCLTRQNTPFVCCVPLEDSQGKMNPWHRSGHTTMEIAKDFWIRRQAEKSNSGYTYAKAKPGVCNDPKWPNMTLDEIITMAFQKDYYINTLDHPILKKLGH